jgi:peptidoglycan-associated lipoprotein
LPNGVENNQNQLEIGAGLVFKFGGGWSRTQEALPTVPPAQQAAEVAFACSENTDAVNAGDLVQVVGNTVTLPADQAVTYTWASTGGAVEQEGHIVTINTSGLAPGEYHVTGHAALMSNPDVAGDCRTSFLVSEPAAASTSAPAENTISEDDFRDHVKDAFFDYDGYDLRPDAQQAMNQDIAYLNAHPGLQIMIGGYADERGSAEFNLALGLNRANSARTALINGGVSPSRIQVISYGKEKQFCSEDAESCYQQNRRAQLVLRR